MGNLGLIEDNVYPFKGIEYKRKTVRAIVVNEKKEIALLHIKGTDNFGNRNHFEVPGGGKEDNEDDLSTLTREVREEIGCSIKNIKLVAFISIQYNLLRRIDEGNFYYCEIDEKLETNLSTYEKEIFSNIIWININEIDNLYLNTKVENVGLLIHKRDYLMIKKAKELGYFD